MEKKEPKNPRRSVPRFTRDRGRSDVADSQELEEIQKQAVQDSLEHLHGLAEVIYKKDELVVLSQVRNSRPYLKAFVEHYFSLGAKHFVFLDNGSTDGTVEYLKNFENVTVLRTELPYRTYNVAMKQYLIERFGKGRWSLLVDIDELFDYPFSDVVSLRSLLGYLNEHSYTAVVAHMLDMFPDQPIREDDPPIEDDPLKEKYRFYDVSDVYSQSYRLAEDTGNVISNEDVKILRGGIRNTLFGNRAYLIKHPLIFYDDEIRPMDLSDHWVGNARVADFSGVLLHYKFTDRLYKDVRLSVAERNRSDNGTKRYSRFLEVLEKGPVLQIKQATSRELKSVEDLISDGFVVVSNEYLNFVKKVGIETRGEDSRLRGRIDQVRWARRKLAEERRTDRRGEADHSPGKVAPAVRMFSRNRDRLDVPATPELERVQRFLLRYDVEHLHGPAEVDYEIDELVVLCLLRNGRPYLKAFVEHYFSLGAKHFVFLDNGSTDGTVEYLKNFENITVLRTNMLFRHYQLLMRQYLIERFGKGRWSLLVDIDELFDYPFSDVVSLRSLLGYLNEHSYTAVVAHMLDMFPDQPIREDDPPIEDVAVKELHHFYDLSNISSFEYKSAEGFENVASNDEIKILKGGVQRKLFNIHPLLIKHPLIFYDDEIRPVDLSEHWVGNARVADFSGVLLHYKLLGLYALVRREIQERRYVNKHGKYDKYLKVLEKATSLAIKGDASRELKSVNELIGTEFNVVSEEYMNFVKDKWLEQGGSLAEHQERLSKINFQSQSEAKAQRYEITQLQQRLQQAEENLYVERRRIKQLEYRNKNLEKKNRNLVRWNEDLKEKLRVAHQPDPAKQLEYRNKNLEKKNRNLVRWNEDLKEKLRVAHQLDLAKQPHLETEWNEVSREAQILRATLSRIRPFRSWGLLNKINKIRNRLFGNKR